MINMSYCRFENTYKALEECFAALDGGEGLKDASYEEQEAFRQLFTEFLEFCWEKDFIGRPNWDVLEDFYEEIENKS